jgi:hypothetical protein
MAFMAVGVVVGWGGLASADDHSKSSKAQVCEAAKLAAVGEKAECLAEEAADAVLGRTPNFAKCEDKFTKAFAKAEQHAGPGVCPTEGDAAAIEATVDACVAGIAVALTGSQPPSCRQFPATGQTTSYQAGDDGDINAGAALSYTDNSDGTITDNNTGLVWEKKTATCPGIHCWLGAYTWAAAFTDFIDVLNDVSGGGVSCFAGHCDWRLPNVKELQSIVNYGMSNPSVSAAFNDCGNGSCTAASAYWASSSLVSNPAVAWVVSFFSGGVGTGAGFKGGPNHVRAVRGGL